MITKRSCFFPKIWNQLQIYISIQIQHANTLIIFEQYTSHMRLVCVQCRSIKPCCSVTTIASSPRRTSFPSRLPNRLTADSNSNWSNRFLELQLRMTTAILQPSYILPDVEQRDEPLIQNFAVTTQRDSEFSPKLASDWLKHSTVIVSVVRNQADVPSYRPFLTRASCKPCNNHSSDPYLDRFCALIFDLPRACSWLSARWNNHTPDCRTQDPGVSVLQRWI